MKLQEWAPVALSALLLKPSTLHGYRSSVRCHIGPALGHVEVADLTSLHCRQLVATMVRQGYAPSTVRQSFFALRSMLHLAVDERLLTVNPCVGVPLPTVMRKQVQPLTMQQVHEVADAAGPYSTLVLWLGLMGTRWSETVGLTWEQFNGRQVVIDRAVTEINGHLYTGTPKSHQSRTLTVPDVLMQQLQPGTGLLFTTQQGKTLRASNWTYRYWRKATAAVGVDTRIHDLRHTCASLLVKAGAHPKEVQVWLGHADISTTMQTYGHLYDDTGSRLATMLDSISIGADNDSGNSSS